MFTRCFALLSALAFMLPCHSNDFPGITFFSSQPDFIEVMNGASPPSDIVDSTNRLLLQSLGFSQPVELVPHGRTDSLMSAVPACTFYKLKTPERSLQYIFSLPTDIYLGIKLYRQRNTADFQGIDIDESGKLINFSGFINRQINLNLLVPTDMSFGDYLDNEIKMINQENIQYIHGLENYERSINAFLLSRADYLLAYPASMHLVDLEELGIESVSISQAPEFISGRVMCNRNPVTQPFIDAVNQALKQLYLNGEFVKAIIPYVPPEEHETVKKIVLENLLNGPQN